ncbi:MAG: GC-type dockerin domain-anchored protein [Phycisphaerales bacterium]
MRSQLLASLCGLAGLAASTACGQTVTALIHEGSPIGSGGLTVATNGIIACAANDAGGYIVSLNASDGLTSFWGSASGGPGAILRTEGQVGLYLQTGFETFFGFSNSGGIAYSPTLGGGEDSVWLDDAPLAIADLPIPTIAGQFWSFASRPTVTSNGVPFWVGGLTATAGGATQNRGLFRGVDATPVLKGGDPLANISELVAAGSSVQFTYKVSGLGTNWIGMVGISAATASDRVVVVNNAVPIVNGGLLREGVLVPVVSGGSGIEAWSNWSDFGINESGTYLACGNTNGAAAGNDFVSLNGRIILREGATIDGLPITGAVQEADLNESGDWMVCWNVNSGGTREAIIFNGRLLIKETDPIDFDGDGAPDTGVTLVDITGIDNVHMSDRRAGGLVDIYFTGDTELGEAAFRITVPAEEGCPADHNGDGGVDGDDVIAFFADWDAGVIAADFNGDGGVDGDDVIEFFARWDAGC